MRIFVGMMAVGFVAVGLWLISIGFMPTASPDAIGGPQIATAPQTTAGPIALGTALLIGGALLFIMLLRRR